MARINRRDFFHHSAGALAATASLSAVAGAAPVAPKATAIRTLGKTGIECSYLGIGTGIRGSAPGITALTLKLTGEEFIGLLEYAYQQGITYFDLADRYGSHIYMREAMKKSIPRDKVMLLSKMWPREPAQVKKDLDRARTELNTDVIDVVLMHCLRGGEEDWPEKLKPTMDVLSEAKAKGQIRAHGVSSHSFPALERVADTEWCDVVLARINPFGVRMDAPTDKVVPVLKKIHEAGKGIIGMKILGEGDAKCVENMDQSIKFPAELGCIDAMTIGFMSKEELDDVKNRIDSVQLA